MTDTRIIPPDWSQLDRIYPVSRETRQGLETYVSLLHKWQPKTNLIANSTINEVWQRHIGDSLQVLRWLDEQLDKHKLRAGNWLDLGTGGGFPGMVVAIDRGCRSGSTENPNPVTLVESNAKKCAFLRQVTRETSAACRVENLRIESLAKQTPAPVVVSARALAALPKLLSWIYPLVDENTIIVLHKGREYRQELEDCNGLWQFDLVRHESWIEVDSVLLEIRNLSAVLP